MSVGDNIKFQRKKAGLKQKELAEMIGQTATSVMHYEKGDRTPSQAVLEKIATALNINPSILFDWDDWENRFNKDGVLSKESQTLDEVKFFYGKDALHLLENFIKLNDTGKQKALNDLDDLVQLDKYTETKEK